ncbi:hypothetical protein FQZ97_1210930 [compost metagenome]
MRGSAAFVCLFWTVPAAATITVARSPASFTTPVEIASPLAFTSLSASAFFSRAACSSSSVRNSAVAPASSFSMSASDVEPLMSMSPSTSVVAAAAAAVVSSTRPRSSCQASARWPAKTSRTTASSAAAPTA